MPESITEPRPAARQTPYELVFGDAAFEAELFPSIREEAAARGASSDDPDAFVLLATVGAALRSLAPTAPATEGAPAGARTGAGSAGTAASPGSEAAARARFHEVGRLFFHAYHFWRHGRALILLDEEPARALAAAPPRVGAWDMVAPAPAGYLQLPRHLFWARTDETAPPEPVDGFFWSLGGAPDTRASSARLDLLLALGLRPGRPGLSVIDAGAVLPPEGHWADIRGRPGGVDFANVLPGGEASGLHALLTRAEALRLASLVFHAAAAPGALGPEREGGSTPPASAHALPPSTLPFRRIRGATRHG